MNIFEKFLYIVYYAQIYKRRQNFQGVSVQDVEEPEIVQPTQVLIEVRAASLDPVDLKVFICEKKM